MHQKSETYHLCTISKPMTIHKETYFSLYNQAKMRYARSPKDTDVESY